MKNKKRLLFYQKKFNYLFLNSSIILVCNNNTNIITNITNYLNKYKLSNNAKIIVIKRKFFTFYCSSVQKSLNSSNLILICFDKNISFNIFSNFLINIYPYYYYIYFNNMCYNLSLSSTNFNNALTTFSNQLFFNFFVILFYLNLYITNK
uniref:Uncharacterized protein orf149 n=1 Tax=Proteromonas lacertae TaxID=42746 RepID=E2E9Z9_PROLC|nr:hypothetical protein PROLAC_038 [Proteromonas lacertae]ADD46354.1 hypothetical protein PROLAC_038 [Proteromonas lacertae]